MWCISQPDDELGCVVLARLVGPAAHHLELPHGVGAVRACTGDTQACPPLGSQSRSFISSSDGIGF